MASDTKAHNQPIYRDIDGSNIEDLESTELESLCMECHEKGTTRLLLTRIPLFREVIISSFSCPHCNNSNSEIMDSATLPDQGVKYTLQVKELKDLNRMVVKANSASFKVPSLDFEIPPKTQKGSINTLEGFIKLSIEGLEKEQPVRKSLYPEVYEQLETFIGKLKGLLEVKEAFTVVVDDPSGNSFVENPMASRPDPCMSVQYYDRDIQQDAALGIVPATVGDVAGDEEEEEEKRDGVDPDEIMSFTENCSNCRNPVETKMKQVDIPHFKQMIIMASNCDFCGYKTNEVKSGAGISEYGTKITLHLTDSTDLSRDILKADTALMRIPEIEFELEPGTLGGRFTTLEGLLVNVKQHLSGSNVFSAGDSATTDDKMGQFLKKLQKVIDGELLDIHIIIDDPAGNSYLQNLYAPDDDPEITVDTYTRTPQQDEELGIDLLKTEDS